MTKFQAGQGNNMTSIKFFAGLILVAIIGLTPVGSYFYGKHVQKTVDQPTIDALSKGNQAAIDKAKLDQKTEDDARVQRAQAALDALQQVATNAVKSYNAAEAKLNELKDKLDTDWYAGAIPARVTSVLNAASGSPADSHTP
jgi:hypothetical protein